MANNVFPPRPPFPPAPPRGRSVPPPPPGVVQYIGARYVPIFADPIEWQTNKIYEPLTIVTYNNSSYTSRQTVPAGISPDNGEYWVETGNYNAQINDLTSKIDGWDEEIAANTQTANEAKATADAAQKAVADLDLTSLQQSVTDAIQAVDDLKPQVETNTDNIATNTASITQNETNISKNSTDIASLQAANTALGNRVSTAETNIGANTSAISGLTTSVSGIDTRMTAAESDISTLQTGLSSTSSQIQTIKDQSDAATAEVERLSGIVGDENSGLIKDFNDLKEAVESGESVEALAGRVGLLENQVGKPASEGQAATGLEKKVADNTAAISANTASISANTTAIGDNASSITDLENTVGHPASGSDPATGLVKSIADNTAAIALNTASINSTNTNVNALQATVGNASSGLVKDVNDNMGDIAALQADVSTIQGQQSAQDTAISGNTTAINNVRTAVNGKQDILSVDSTLNFTYKTRLADASGQNNFLGVKYPVLPLTRAQYDALTTKSSSTLYVITDE